MGCLFSFFVRKKPEIIVAYCILSGLEYLRLKGNIIVGIDRQYSIRVFDTCFNDFYETSVSLWPKMSAHKNYFDRKSKP